ncbi:MAG: hypothetical protein PHD03_03005 [Bacilli bacterium]|nr:hypothetical protein [Bacilli bacterium]MDD4407164.1 hypothetical protein [Bacilli bacterium]
MKKTLIISLVAIGLIIVGFLFFNNIIKKDYSYVILKINPEVELAIDYKEVVREVNPLNEDADILISDLNLVGKSLEEVTKTIIDETIEIGKFDKTIELNVINKSEDKRLKLENKLKEKIASHIQAKSYNAILTVKGVTEDIKASATSYNISNGKMLLISKALEINSDLKVEDLVNQSVKEIQTYIKDASIKRREVAEEIKNQTSAERKSELTLKKANLKQVQKTQKVQKVQKKQKQKDY